jgi:hypothetical protein
MSYLKRRPVAVTASHPGVGRYLYIAATKEFTSIASPLPTGTGTVVGDEAIISANHTFRVPSPLPSVGFVNGFIRIPLLAKDDSAKWTTKNVGEPPAMKVETMFEVNATGTNPEQIEMLKRLQGEEIIALIQEADCDDPKLVQIGCDCKVVDALKFDFDKSTNKMKFSGVADCYPAFYEGALTLMTH